jgi:hypothetical protein
MAAARYDRGDQVAVDSWVRFTFALPKPDAAVQARRLHAAIELAQFKGDGAVARITFHPLCGGIPLDAAPECLRLFAERVMPALAVTGGTSDG